MTCTVKFSKKHREFVIHNQSDYSKRVLRIPISCFIGDPRLMSTNDVIDEIRRKTVDFYGGFVHLVFDRVAKKKVAQVYLMNFGEYGMCEYMDF